MTFIQQVEATNATSDQKLCHIKMQWIC